MKAFCILFAVQYTQYLVLTVNYRSIAHEQYLMAAATAALAAVLAYTIVRRIVRDESRWGLAGMVAGGALADMTGIWLTRSWGS